MNIDYKAHPFHLVSPSPSPPSIFNSTMIKPTFLSNLIKNYLFNIFIVKLALDLKLKLDNKIGFNILIFLVISYTLMALSIFFLSYYL